MEERKEHKEHHEHKNVVEDAREKESEISFKKNPWMIATIILGIVIVGLLIYTFRAGLPTGAAVSIPSDEAGKKVVDFAKAQGTDATLVKVNEKSGLYEVLVLISGKEIPVYVTKDGENLVLSLIPLSQVMASQCKTNADCQANEECIQGSCAAKPQEVPKTDKPKVQGFFFSYCPYGTQFEKAMVPVYDLLKNKADIGVVFIGAMHGEYERVESLRQICIEKNYGKDKLWKYLNDFNTNSAIGSCGGTDTCVNPLIENIYKTNSIDKTKIETCMKNDAPALYDAQVKLSSSLGISGSPTFVINGVQVQVERSPEAVKKAICDSFTTAPSECTKVLSTTAASPGFGASASTSGNSGTQCA
jgi:hypothetical protein